MRKGHVGKAPGRWPRGERPRGEGHVEMARRCHSQAEQLPVARREPEQDRTLGHLSGHLTLPRILVPGGASCAWPGTGLSRLPGSSAHTGATRNHHSVRTREHHLSSRVSCVNAHSTHVYTPCVHACIKHTYLEHVRTHHPHLRESRARTHLAHTCTHVHHACKHILSINMCEHHPYLRVPCVNERT